MLKHIFVGVCLVGFAAPLAEGAQAYTTALGFPGAVSRAASSRRHEGIPSIAVSPVNGRMWVTWYASATGAEDAGNYAILSTSSDGGKTWREVAHADPDGCGPLRAFDPEVWISPDGKLRWFWTERVSPVSAANADPYAGAKASAAKDRLMMATLDAEREPDKLPLATTIARGIMMCKPIVMRDGAWLLPVANWQEERSSGVVRSDDGGRTFRYLGGASMPKEDREFDEHIVFERKDGRLSCWSRAKSGIRTAQSSDGGVTWSPLESATVRHTHSRFFIARLASGALLLVKHGAIDRNVGRKDLMAFVSDDDGATWTGGLMLDERKGVSYPDGVQVADGRILVVYDRNRRTDREILFCEFTEADARAGQDVSGKVRLRRKVSSTEPRTLHLAGDSTLAWRRPDESSGSWGEALRSNLRPSARICNYAIAGRSTVTFRPQWETNLIGRVKKGDSVLIQFGHNDPCHSPKKLVDREGCDRFCTVEAFRTNLTRFVREAQARGADVLLLTPTPQRAFFGGTEWKLSKRHLPYFAVIPEVARETGADFIDMTALGSEIVKAMGVKGSRSFYRVNANGKPDDIHPNKEGARRLARLFLDEVKRRELSVGELFMCEEGTDETESVQRRLDDCFRAGGGTVTLEKGVYRVGGLRVRSNTTLHLKAGAVLLGTRSVAAYDIMGTDALEPLDAEDVPREDSAWIPAKLRKGKRNMAFARAGSRWNNSIIRIYKAKNVKIIAEKGAVIDGQNSYDPQGEEHYRGVHGISAHKSRNLEFRGYTIRHSGNWAHNVKDCRDVVFSDLEILAGHDGVHISSCDNVRIEGCTMKTGDDCVAGFDNRDVRVSGCTLNTACSAFRFGGTRFLAEKCRCYGPAEYLFRGSLSKAEKAEGLMASQTGRRNMLALFTYYADKSLDIREQPKEMTFRDITVEDADRFVHYNFSGNEVWQLGMPLGSVRFENVTATGLKMPLCVYGEESRPISLTFDRVSVRFGQAVPEFIRGAWIDSLTAKDLTIEGVEGPFFRNWSTLVPKFAFEGAAPANQTVQSATGAFKVRPI